MYLIPFKSDHAKIMMSQGTNAAQIGMDPDHFDIFNNLEFQDKSFTAVKDNSFICSGGIVPMWHGVFEGWVIGSNKIWDYPLLAARTIRKGLDKLYQEHEIVRLQTAVRSDFPKGIRFAKWLGFKEEGLMKKYDIEGKDFIRFARIT
jgi:hypothetical protein|tara:strand:+ start:3120 stop:3560 length:441 start_codon:yes stop_codon:yes gene_type:complete